MSRIIVGTTPKQVAPQNNKRFSLSVEYIASSVVAGNSGLVYGKFGSAPVASINSNTWDFVLNPGSIDGTNIDGASGEAHDKGELWLVADAAEQIINIVERYLADGTPPKSSGAVPGQVQ